MLISCCRRFRSHYDNIIVHPADMQYSTQPAPSLPLFTGVNAYDSTNSLRNDKSVSAHSSIRRIPILLAVDVFYFLFLIVFNVSLTSLKIKKDTAKAIVDIEIPATISVSNIFKILLCGTWFEGSSYLTREGRCSLQSGLSK